MKYKGVIKKILNLIKTIIGKIIRKINSIGHKLYNLCHYYVKVLLRSKKHHTFAVITATYNSEKYLEDYFQSICSVDYDLDKIEVIVVDDGSTDTTSSIVKKWIKKSKLNIIYIYQENKGQAVARNKGLEVVQNEWVTFIDSDDFINNKYFENVNFAINLTKGKSIISTKWISYYEDLNKCENNHPLNYRFEGVGKVQIKNMIKDKDSFQLAMNSVFFKYKTINKYNIKLLNIKPQFEDAVFVMDYLRKSNNYNIAFVTDALYYYRKRSNGSSTLDKAHTDTRRYVELLNEAYIKVLKDFKEENKNIPKFVQNAIIYDLSWNIKELESNKVILSSEQRELRETYLQQIFNYIDFKSVGENWKYLWNMYQIGINYKYYNGQEKAQKGIYLHYQTDTYYKYLLIDVEDKWSIYLNNKLQTFKDLEAKLYIEKVNDEFFINKRFVKISKYFDNVKIKYNDIEQRLPKENKKNTTFNKDSLIIFYDRKNKADDNAEIMYEWMQNNHPEFSNMYFAIEKSCKDYNRLKGKNFNLIDYGTKEFEELYIKADYILSSGLDKSIENYKNLRYNVRGSKKSEAKFIFLQHGIITDDLSHWFSAKRVDKVITSVNFEYNNLINKYNLFKEEVILTGLPRYDRLYNKPKNEILVQFTWRMQYKKYDLEQIKETKYFKNIIRLLTDETLQETLKQYKYILKFIPHPETNKFIDYLKQYENELIKICNISDTSFRDEFATAKLMVTDYSSVFTDFAYLNKPVIYYQYDKEQFYKKHLYTSEMDYEQEGLGSVQTTYEDLTDKINNYIANDCLLEEEYLKRIQNFFKYKDQNNCQRLYTNLSEKILEVGKEKNFINLEILKGKDEEKIVGNIFLMINNKKLYTINIDSVKEKVSYYNIIIPKEILLDSFYKLKVINETNGEYKLFVSTLRKNTLKQENYNKKYKVEKENFYNADESYSLHLSKRGNLKNPKKILISFGSYGHFDAEVRYPISYFGSLNEKLDETLVIVFQDQYFVDGTYFLVDDEGRNLRSVLVSYIYELMKKYNLDEGSLIFYGASKGATVAIDIASNFKKNNVFINAPQINLDNFIRSRIHHYGLVYQYLKYYREENYDIRDKLKELIKNNKVCYAYSALDVSSNCNIIESLEHINLEKKDFKVLHRQVASIAWEWQEKKILEIIS